MLRRPQRVRLHVIADINSARPQQRERLVEQDMLAGAAIGEDNIEGIWLLAQYHRASVFAKYRQSWVRSKMRPGNRLNLGIDVDRYEPCRCVHAVKQPRGSNAGSGADFE